MFVDTNVLVQARFVSAPFHERARGRLAKLKAGDVRLSLSRQILREYLAVTTRPQSWAIPLPTTQAAQDVQDLIVGLEVLEDGPAVWVEFMRLCRTVPFAGRQVHDANIAATMLAHGESELLTFNGADFVRFGPTVTITVP